MKCKNDLCQSFSEEFVGNCMLFDDKEVSDCETKKRFDRRALVAGTIEIEQEEDNG